MWSYKKDGITQSFIRAFRKCKYQTYLGYVKGLTPKKMSKGLLFGQIGHHILENYYQEIKDTGVLSCRLEHYSDKFINDFCDKFPDMVSSQNPKDFEKMLAEVEGLTQGYLQNVFKTQENAIWEIVDVEKEFKVPYRGSLLRGKMDLIVKHRKKGTYYVKDHKFLFARADIDQIGSMLRYDVQCNMYAYAAIQLDIPIKGIIYNIVRKPGLRQKVNESLEEYMSRIYMDTVVQPNKYFFKVNGPILIADLMKWEKEFLQPTVDEIKAWEDNDFSPRQLNDDELLTKYGPSQFYKYIVEDATYDYTKKERVFPELGE